MKFSVMMFFLMSTSIMHSYAQGINSNVNNTPVNTILEIKQDLVIPAKTFTRSFIIQDPKGNNMKIVLDYPISFDERILKKGTKFKIYHMGIPYGHGIFQFHMVTVDTNIKVKLKFYDKGYWPKLSSLKKYFYIYLPEVKQF